MQTKIGFIGIGIMGKPMALNILKAGYSLTTFSRRIEAVDTLVKVGARVVATPQEVGAASDIIITMVSDTHDVEEVLLGKNGVVHGAKPGAVVIDMSTISPSATRSIAKQLAMHQISMLDAPVSGGEQGAIDGTLSIMVGGKAEAVEKVKSIFEILGKQCVHIGDHGAGQVAKACNQIIIAESIVSVTEALQLAIAEGVDPLKVREALLGGYASSRVLEVHGLRILNEAFQPGFKAKLHQKDMRLALDEARELGVAMPGAAFATQLLNVLVNEGKENLDSSAIAMILKRMSANKEI